MGKQITFCGGGNMAEGILAQLLAKEITEKNSITVIEIKEDRCAYLSETYGVNAVTSPGNAYAKADMIILALLPHLIPKIVPSFADEISKDAVVISIAAGIPIATLEECLGREHRIARVMPNTLARSGSGYSAVCYNNSCGAADKDFVKQVLASLGQTMVITEDTFDSFSCFASAGPMWMYKLIEAMTDAGVYVGYSREDARNITIRNMIGAACMVEITGDHPAVLVDRMTSPGGVTIESLKTLQEEGFAAAIIKSVSDGVRKAKSFR